MSIHDVLSWYMDIIVWLQLTEILVTKQIRKMKSYSSIKVLVNDVWVACAVPNWFRFGCKPKFMPSEILAEWVIIYLLRISWQPYWKLAIWVSFLLDGVVYYGIIWLWLYWGQFVLNMTGILFKIYQNLQMMLLLGWSLIISWPSSTKEFIGVSTWS